MGFKRHHQVYIYTSPGSKLCELAKQYFRNNGIDFIEIDVSRNENAKSKMVEISEQALTPVVEFDGRVVSGYRPDVYEIMVKEGNQEEEKTKEKAEE